MLDILRNHGYTGNILKKGMGIAAGILVAGLILGMLYAGFFTDRQGKEILPSMEEILADPSAVHAAILRGEWESEDEARRRDIETTLRAWIEASLESYRQEQIGGEEMTERIEFLQVCGVLEEEAADWVLEKERLDGEFRARNLYDEALAWYEQGQYSLARESAAMISAAQPAYYEKAQALLGLCGEKEEEKEAEALLLAEAKRRKRVAEIYQAYEEMETGEEGTELWNQYEQALREIADEGERQELREKYPLTEWKWACKCFLLGDFVSHEAEFGLLYKDTEIPWLMVLEESMPRIYRWSALRHQWIETEFPQAAQGYVYFGADLETGGFLFGKISQAEREYLWLELKTQGWEVAETMKKSGNTETYKIDEEPVEQKEWEERLLIRIRQCGEKELLPITGETLREALEGQSIREEEKHERDKGVSTDPGDGA